MKFEEILPYLREGKRVVNKESRGLYNFIYIDEELGTFFGAQNQQHEDEHRSLDINYMDIFSESWELYEEQKAKVKKWLWAYFDHYDYLGYIPTKCFYSEQEVKEYEEMKDAIKLEHTMIEVEE